MRIKLIDVENYKRIRKAVVVPGERHVIYIAGPNEAGKSSFIDAITECLGGKKSGVPMPIRRGEKSASIRIDLIDEADKLEYQVVLRFLPSGNSSLKVTGKDGKLSSPQKILDRIVGNRCLDPLKFMDLSDKEQRITLLKIVDIGIDLDEWAKERKKHFDARTDANRDVKRHQIELDNNPNPGEIPEEVSSNLSGKVSELMAQSGARRDTEVRLNNLRDKAKRVKETIARIHEELEAENDILNDHMAEGKELKAKFEAMPDVAEQLEQAQTDLSESSAKQQTRLKLVAQQERHTIAVELVGRAEDLSDELTTMLKTMDENKAAKLAAAKMPIKGLSIGDECLLLDDIPLSQASGSKKIFVGLSLAAAMSPHLDDIWVKDGSLLDDDKLKLMEEFAKKMKKRIWIEIVGESHDGALIFEEGAIKV